MEQNATWEADMRSVCKECIPFQRIEFHKCVEKPLSSPWITAGELSLGRLALLS
jgi:hypothetical protein